jgi:glutamine amidotransferase
MGNFASIENMLKLLGFDTIVTSDPLVLNQAEKIILPGVGSFDYGMKNLKHYGLLEILRKKVLVDNTPILGICLGMQLLTNSSEEGNSPGLSLIDARTVKFNFPQSDNSYKIPNMGWNYITKKRNDLLFKTNHEIQKFYFVHSYHVLCNDSNDVLATTRYGIDFVSAFKHKNVYGVQFHPEKSHKYGLDLIKNFAEFEV